MKALASVLLLSVSALAVPQGQAEQDPSWHAHAYDHNLGGEYVKSTQHHKRTTAEHVQSSVKVTNGEVYDLEQDPRYDSHVEDLDPVTPQPPEPTYQQLFDVAALQEASDPPAGCPFEKVPLVGAMDGDYGEFYGTDGYEKYNALVTDITAYVGPHSIHGVLVSFSNDQHILVGTNEGQEYSLHFHSAEERVTKLSLYRERSSPLAGIYIQTDAGQEWFPHTPGVHASDRHYNQETGSGLIGGLRFIEGPGHVEALGFAFLKPVSKHFLAYVHYPDIDLDALPLTPETLDHFEHVNTAYAYNPNSPDIITYDQVHNRTERGSWVISNQVSLGEEFLVKAGIPKLLDIEKNAGIEIGVEGVRKSEWSYERLLRWQYETEVPPRSKVTFQALTHRCDLNLPFEGAMVLETTDGTRFAYRVEGEYQGVNYTKVRTTKRVDSLDDFDAYDDVSHEWANLGE